jgi:hypothetical protein
VPSFLRFALVVVPTAVLATAAVVGVSRNGRAVAATSDGDLQRDLELASSTTIELAPLGQPLATVSSIEAPPEATPKRTTRPKRSPSGSRAVRSRAPVVRAAPEPEVAESSEESETTESTQLADASTEAVVEAPAPGGVELPRPTAIPVSFPTGGAGAGTYDPGTVIRGGGIDPDHCQIHGGIYRRRPPIYRQPRGITLGDRILRAVAGGDDDRPRSIGDRVRSARPSAESPRTGSGSRGTTSIGERVRGSQDRSASRGSDRSASRGSLADRVRAARGRS